MTTLLLFLLGLVRVGGIAEYSDRGFRVCLAADAVTSRKLIDRDLALQTARSAGALVVSSEALLFMMLRDAKNPAFKAVSKLVR